MLQDALVIRWTSAPAFTSTTDGSWVTEKLSASSCTHSGSIDWCEEMCSRASLESLAVVASPQRPPHPPQQKQPAEPCRRVNSLPVHLTTSKVISIAHGCYLGVQMLKVFNFGLDDLADVAPVGGAADLSACTARAFRNDDFVSITVMNVPRCREEQDHGLFVHNS